MGAVGVIADPAATTPLLGLLSQIAPIIVSGNTVVALASEAAPLPAILLGEDTAVSDLPAGVVNLLTGLRAELVPTFATHEGLRALDAAGVSAEEAKTLGLGAAESVKRLRVRVRGDRSSVAADPFSPDAQGVEEIGNFLEFKTVWHPVGALTGSAPFKVAAPAPRDARQVCPQRLLQQRAAWFHAMPGGGAGWGAAAAEGQTSRPAGCDDPPRKQAADERVELELFRAGHELRDRQPADRQHERRPDEGDLAGEPRGAVGDLRGVRHPVAAARGRLAGKTAADRGEMKTPPDRGLVPADRAMKPAKQRPPRGVGKGPADHRLAHARRLADKQHPAAAPRRPGPVSRHRRRPHGGASPAPAQPRVVMLKQQRAGVRGGRERGGSDRIKVVGIALSRSECQDVGVVSQS